MSLTRQWLRNGVEIAGATSAEYVVKSSDVGAKLMTKIGSKSAPICTDNPTIIGTPQEGQVLTCKRGSWLG